MSDSKSNPTAARSRTNRSAAVMAKRTASRKSLDYFPTPPWATRALMEHVLKPRIEQPTYGASHSCLEPACGGGHMAEVLREYFAEVKASDVHDYGYRRMDSQADFLFPADDSDPPDWIITNPPFTLAADFAHRAYERASHGVALLCRLSFAESKGRYEELFAVNPPVVIAQFVERVGMAEGRLDRNAEAALAFAWFVWESNHSKRGARFKTEFQWIPPCRTLLERNGDYEESNQ